jgi:hypothetical protein
MKIAFPLLGVLLFLIACTPSITGEVVAEIVLPETVEAELVEEVIQVSESSPSGTIELPDYSSYATESIVVATPRRRRGGGGGSSSSSSTPSPSPSISVQSTSTVLTPPSLPPLG